MKNLKNSLFVLAILFTVAACNKSEDFTPKEAAEHEIVTNDTVIENGTASSRETSVEIYFGMAIPFDGGCFALGICKITVGKKSEAGGGDAEATVAYSEDENFTITFRNPQDHPELEGDYFQMDGPYTIPDDLAAELGGDPYTISGGQYPIVHVGGTAVVEFPR